MMATMDGPGNTEKQASQGSEEQQQEEERRPSAFAGDLTLEGLRVNQLKLSRNLTGTVLLSEDRFQIRAKVGHSGKSIILWVHCIKLS